MQLKITKTAVDRLTPSLKPYDVFDTEQTGLVFRLEPSGARNWYFAYRIRGARRRYKIGAFPGVSVEGARSLAKKLAGKVAERIDPQAEREQERAQAARDRISTLRAFLDQKYEPWALQHLKTAKAQLQRIRADFATWLDKPMSSLSELLVEGWRRAELKRGLSRITVNRNLQRLHAVLTKAKDWKVIGSYPFSVKPLKVDRRGKVRYLTSDEDVALRGALTGREHNLAQARERFNEWRQQRGRKRLPVRSGDHLRPMVLLALHTGMRRGELLSARWRHVAGAAIEVPATSAKSGQTRYIPLNTEAVQVLKEWRERQTYNDPDDFLFAVTRGQRMTTITHAWKAAIKLSKIQGFRFHDLRHTFASRLVMAGVPLNTVRELMGHSDIAMTLRYAHLAPGNLQEAVAKLA